MAMGDPWIVGRVVFSWPFFGPPPCPALDPYAIYRAAPREEVTAADDAEAQEE